MKAPTHGASIGNGNSQNREPDTPVTPHDRNEFASSTSVKAKPQSTSSSNTSSSPHQITHNSPEKDTDSSEYAAGPDSFDMISVIGEGGYGKVLLVRLRESNELFAMKVVSKQYLVKKNTVSYMHSERDIMTRVDHPFLVSLKWAFQSPTKVNS
jgi:hypothetical protein